LFVWFLLHEIKQSKHDNSTKLAAAPCKVNILRLKIHSMQKEVKATKEEKMEDSLYYRFELSAELLKKVQERDAKNSVQGNSRQIAVKS
jgi:hypothetical protein